MFKKVYQLVENNDVEAIFEWMSKHYPAFHLEEYQVILKVAVVKNRSEIAKLVLERDIKLHSSFIPTAFAAAQGYYELLSILLEYYPEQINDTIRFALENPKEDLFATIIRFAVKHEREDLIVTIVGSYPEYAHVKDDKKRNLLHRAARHGFQKLARLLINAKVEVNTQDVNGHTPLHYAARFGQVNIVRLLLANSAHVDQKSTIGLTPLHYAARSKCLLAMKILIDHGADLKQKVDNLDVIDFANTDDDNEDGSKIKKINEYLFSKFDPAPQVSDDLPPDIIETFQQLINQVPSNENAIKESIMKHPQLCYVKINIVEVKLNRAKPKKYDENKCFSILHWAAYHNKVHLLEYVMQNGIDPNVNVDGITPLHLAAANGNNEAVTVLLKNGANINAAFGGRFTAIDQAVAYNHEKTFLILLAEGASIRQGTLKFVGRNVAIYDCLVEHGIAHQVLDVEDIITRVSRDIPRPEPVTLFRQLMQMVSLVPFGSPAYGQLLEYIESCEDANVTGYTPYFAQQSSGSVQPRSAEQSSAQAAELLERKQDVYRQHDF